jgi:hypothetical protein
MDCFVASAPRKRHPRALAKAGTERLERRNDRGFTNAVASDLMTAL